jgi:hypothetical protein
MKQFDLPYVQGTGIGYSPIYSSGEICLTPRRERSMFPWYVDTALVFLVLAGFWGVWIIPGRGGR